MPFFDFHIHPTLKCFFSEDNAEKGTKKLSPWIDIDIVKVNWLLRWCTEFDFVLQSQNNLAQLISSQTNFICVALYMPELAMTTDKLLIGNAQNTKLNIYLQPYRLDELNGTATDDAGKILPPPAPYPDLLKEDLEKVLLLPERFGINDKRIIPLSRGVKYDPADLSSIYVVFSIEGCHTLLPSLTDTTVRNKDVVINNLKELSAQYPVVSINLTHLQQFPFCNHAYGILFVDNPAFIPVENRIAADGVEIIRHCYTNKILIDIKHMSLAARKMLITDIRQRPDFAVVNQPLVCTHAGFAGISYNDIPDYLVYKNITPTYGFIAWGKPTIYGLDDDCMTAFNPSSINLYDDDIIAILESGGMIGLNLDKRILGYSDAAVDIYPKENITWDEDFAFEAEYISTQEVDCFLNANPTGSKITDAYCITVDIVNKANTPPQAEEEYHLYHFMSHILHLIKVALANNYNVNKALTQICIGSDFDGLINPGKECMTALEKGDFKKDFISLFEKYAAANNDIVQLPAGFECECFCRTAFL